MPPIYIYIYSPCIHFHIYTSWLKQCSLITSLYLYSISYNVRVIRLDKFKVSAFIYSMF